MKRRFTFATVTIIALIGFWRAMTPEEEAVPTIETDPHFVDAYIRNFTMTSLNEDGNPDYTLTASLLEHFNDTGESDITEPVFKLIQSDNSWMVSAKRGNIDKDKTWVIFSGDVLMLQQETDNPVTIRTSWLRFNTRTQVADTDKPVDIDQGATVIKSNGMVYNNYTGQLELLAGVNGTYVKP